MFYLVQMMGVPFWHVPFWHALFFGPLTRIRDEFFVLLLKLNIAGGGMKKPRVDCVSLQGHRGPVTKNATRPAKPKGILGSDAANCIYCRLALGEGAVDTESREASFDDLCAWHKARVLSGS